MGGISRERVVEALVQDGCLSRGTTGIVHVVVLVPTLALIPQTIDEWHKRRKRRECPVECEVTSV